jgi:hypothetical protein
MKMMKWALLGGAALAVTATAARADDLTDLKAQIEALQNRVTQLESQPQASMPSGYSMMAIRDGQGSFQGATPERYADQIREDSGFTLSVLPTADAAPVAEVSVSGEIRTVLFYTDDNFKFRENNNEDSEDYDSDEDSLDIKLRGRIFIRGKVDTAVGEVGGYFRLEASGGGDFTDYDETTHMNKAYGWWQFAPEWKLVAGQDDMTAAIQAGWDWDAATSPAASGGMTDALNEFIRLVYASGPLSFAIALEDPDFDTTTTGPTTGPISTVIFPGHPSVEPDTDVPNVQAYLMYSTDTFLAQVVGLYQATESSNDDWALGAGVKVGIAEGFTVSAGAVIGEGTTAYRNNVGAVPLTLDEEFWAGSIGLIANLAEDTRLELGVGYEDYDHAQAFAAGGGIYWDPVSQLTLGAGATYVERDFDHVDPAGDEFDEGDVDDDTIQVWFGTWFRFP